MEAKKRYNFQNFINYCFNVLLFKQKRSEALDLYYAIRKSSSHSYKTDAFAKVLKVILEDVCRGDSMASIAQMENHMDHLKVVKLCHEFPELLRK